MLDENVLNQSSIMFLRHLLGAFPLLKRVSYCFIVDLHSFAFDIILRKLQVPRTQVPAKCSKSINPDSSKILLIVRKFSYNVSISPPFSV